MNKIFVDVDTQGDFVDDNGALAVPNAGTLRPIWKKLTMLAKDQNIPLLKTMDEHDGTEPEMLAAGGPFPPHCLEGTEGQASIIETGTKKAIIFPKKCYDVFDKTLGNPNFAEWIAINEVTEAWVYGIAGNICVESVVMGLLKRGIKTLVFENAVMWMDLEQGIFCQGPDNKEQSMKRMRKAGAQFVQARL